MPSSPLMRTRSMSQLHSAKQLQWVLRHSCPITSFRRSHLGIHGVKTRFWPQQGCAADLSNAGAGVRCLDHISAHFVVCGLKMQLWRLLVPPQPAEADCAPDCAPHGAHPLSTAGPESWFRDYRINKNSVYVYIG